MIRIRNWTYPSNWKQVNQGPDVCNLAVPILVYPWRKGDQAPPICLKRVAYTSSLLLGQQNGYPFYERSCLHRWRGGSVVECSDMVIDI